MSSPRHLYVHVPFCAHRCGYCDFVTVSRMPEMHDRYIAALQHEYAIRTGEGGDLATVPDAHTYSTIFIGGGTPTLLNHTALSALLGWLAALAAPNCEITIECNPETVTSQLAELLVKAGVSRVSLGAQSLTPSVLTTLERRADPETVISAFATLRAAGIQNMSLDVIWGVPDQTQQQLEDDLKRIAELGPNHISAYELEVKPGTRLARAHSGWYASDRDETDEFYDCVIDTLQGEGYQWYELANFAKDEMVCRHNVGYWHGSDYVGLGLGAVGTVRGQRRRNTPGIHRYFQAIEAGHDCPAEFEVILPATATHERIMLGLRLAEGVIVTHQEMQQAIDPEGLSDLSRNGLIDVQAHQALDDRPQTQLTATRRGRMLLNGVLGSLLRQT